MSRANGGCPCGRVHRAPTRKRGRRAPTVGLSGKIVQAQWAGKATQDAETGIWHIDYHGDCIEPPNVRLHGYRWSPTLTVDGVDNARYNVRCRKCGPCRRAMRNYWGYAAMKQTLNSQAEGGRTWFGTLTCDDMWQGTLKMRAMMNAPSDLDIDWKNNQCEEVFRRVCAEFLREVQKYWKRLRNDGHSFKYIAVFEPHKSGKPHCHFLLHELKGDRVLKRELRDRWPCGFIGATLVGGTARQAADPNKAAWYAVKYLSKHTQTRIRASRGYVPEKRAEPHREDTSRENTSEPLTEGER